MTATGWDNGLNQDYCKGLGKWLASRLDSRQVVREQFEGKDMTNIIELARQAGLELNWFDDNFPVLHGKLITLEQLIRADERELCAKVCEETDIVEYVFGGQTHDDAWNTLMVAAAAIRARGQA